MCIIQYVRVKQCPTGGQGSGFIGVQWGCDITCSSTSVGVDVLPLTDLPVIDLTPTAGDFSYCYGPNHAQPHGTFITNNGLSTARNLYFNLFRSGFDSYMDIDNNFSIVTTAGDTLPLIADSIGISLTDSSLCSGDNTESYQFLLPDLQPGEQLEILWTEHICCPPADSCGNVHRFPVWRINATYIGPCSDDSLSTTSKTIYPAVTNYEANANVVYSGATDLYENQPASLEFDMVGAISTWPSDTSGMYCVDITLDDGIVFVDTLMPDSSFYWVAATGDTMYSDSTAIMLNSNGFQIIRGYFDELTPSESNNSYVVLEVEGECAAPPVSHVGFNLFHIASTNCTDTCAMPLGCLETIVTVHCPGCLRQGILSLGYEIDRISYGLPDHAPHDGLPDASGTVDLTQIRTDRAMVGDTLQANLHGEVLLNAAFNPWPFIDSTVSPPDSMFFRWGYCESAFSCIDEVEPLDADVIFFDASTGITHTYTVPASTVTIVGGSIFFYDFSLIHGYSGMDTTLTWENGDDIRFRPRYKVTGNIGADIQSCNVMNKIYLGAAPFPTVDTLSPDCGGTASLGNVTQCGTEVQYYCEQHMGTFNLVGYETQLFNTFGVQAGCCNEQAIQSRYRFKVGPVSNSFFSGTNVFPKEYRNWATLAGASFNLPTDFDSCSSKILLTRNIGGTAPFWAIETDYVPGPDSVSAGYAGYDLNQYFQDSTIVFPDDDFQMQLHVGVTNSCELMPSDTVAWHQYNWTVDGAYDFGDWALCDTNSDSSFSGGNITRFYPPVLSFNIDNKTEDANSNVVCWTIDVSNNPLTTNGHAYNVFVAQSSGSSNLTIDQVNNITGGYTADEINGIYTFDTIFANQTTEIEICADYNCLDASEGVLDSITIVIGYQCPEFTDSISNYPCNLDTIVLYADPLDVNMATEVSFPDTIDICEAFPVTMVINATANGGTLNPIDMEGFTSGGLSFVSGSGTLTYNGTTNSIADPSITGGDFLWDLSTLDSTLNADGLVSGDSLIVNFLLQGDCDLTPSETIELIVTGYTNCSDTLVETTTPLLVPIINGYPDPVNFNYNFSASGTGVCDSTATISVSLENTSTLPLDSGYVFSTDLTGLTYINGYTPGTYAPDSLVASGGLLTGALPGGVPADSSVIFSFDVLLNSCGTLQVPIQVNLLDTLFCDSATNCAIDIVAITDSVSIGPILPAFDSISLDTLICGGTAANFFASGCGGITWNIGGISSGADTTIVFNVSDTIIATATLDNGCASIDTSFTVIIYKNCCLIPGTIPYTIGDSLVSTPQVWNSPEIIEGTITVQDGASLTVSLTTLQFGPEGKIIVEPNAFLFVDNAILTSIDDSCGLMWQGIEIWGDGDAAMPPSGTGAQINNNAEIRNAHIGVLVGARILCHTDSIPCSSLPLYDLSKSGGRLQMEVSSMVNNGRAVDVQSNTAATSVVINGCEIYAPNLLDEQYDTVSSTPYPNATNPWASRANDLGRGDYGLRTWGNQVRLTVVQVNFHDLEKSIDAINQDIALIDQCTFTEAKYGVRLFDYISGFGGNQITSNEFTDLDSIGVLLDGMRFDYINDNTFINNGVSQEDYPYGVFSRNSGGFQITDSEFDNMLVGSVCINSDSLGGFIGEEFDQPVYTGVRVGIASAINNPNLQLRCNIHLPDVVPSINYIRNWHNFQELGNQGRFFPSSFPFAGIIGHFFPAGNEFRELAQRDVQSFGIAPFGDYLYVHHDTILTPEVNPEVNSPITKLNTGYEKQPNSCIPLFVRSANATGGLIGSIDSLETVRQQLTGQLNTLAGLLDGGITQTLLDAVATFSSPSQLENLLVANSPLSDPVLLAYIERGTPPPPQFSAVLEANMPVNSSVWPPLKAELATMPQSFRDYLTGLQLYNPNFLTTESIQRELEQVVMDQQVLINTLITDYLNDTIDPDQGKLAAEGLLEAYSNEQATRTLAAQALSDGDLVRYQQFSSQVNNQGTCELNLETLNDILEQLETDGRTIYELSVTELTTIRNISSGDAICIATSNAKTIRRLVDGYDELIIVDLEGDYKSLPQRNSQHSITQSRVMLGEPFPNPTTGIVAVPFTLGTLTNGEIVVTDIAGRVVISQGLSQKEGITNLNLSPYANGVYNYQLWANGIMLQTKKLILNK